MKIPSYVEPDINGLAEIQSCWVSSTENNTKLEINIYVDDNMWQLSEEPSLCSQLSCAWQEEILFQDFS